MSVPRIEANPHSPWNLPSIRALSMYRLSENTLRGEFWKQNSSERSWRHLGKWLQGNRTWRPAVYHLPLPSTLWWSVEQIMGRGSACRKDTGGSEPRSRLGCVSGVWGGFCSNTLLAEGWTWPSHILRLQLPLSRMDGAGVNLRNQAASVRRRSRKALVQGHTANQKSQTGLLAVIAAGPVVPTGQIPMPLPPPLSVFP